MESQIDIPRVSEMLYVGLCYIIGTPTQVKIRRDVSNTIDMIFHSEEVNESFRIMESGSYREGFRLATSDVDTMMWFIDNKVVCDLSQIPPYHPKQTLILMECRDTPPGFAKLLLLRPTNNNEVRLSCVRVNDQVYISSCLYREVMQIASQLSPFCKSTTLHGPCTSGKYLGTMDYDFAHCFSCISWPLPAHPWIDRCRRQGWPPPHLLQDIISSGCHLVAIGSGRSTSPHLCENEWRISFSQAENKLVSSMNHTQFLCYGFLKIFLKEVLCVGLEDPLLCSYFMKTTLFWKIQESTISFWCSKNILHCVWTCFKYLIHCVYRGEFPNFFIPKNMFINKIHGAAQENLFLQLMNLYNMGFSCLLMSSSLRQILAVVKIKPQLQVSTDESNIISKLGLDIELFKEIHSSTSFSSEVDLDVISKCIMRIDNLYKTLPPSSQNHIATLYVNRKTLLVRTAFLLEKSGDMHTIDNCSPLDMLIKAPESGLISDTLYIAMYLYNKSRHTEALYYIERTKQNLSQPYILHIHNGGENGDRYMKVVGSDSLIEKIRNAVSFDIVLDPVCCIDELRPEMCVTEQKGKPIVFVPPLVMTHMLSFLCHHHLGDRLKSRQSLEDLQTLLYDDEGHYIHQFIHRDISWQMLRICEQIYGDKEKALYSYQ